MQTGGESRGAARWATADYADSSRDPTLCLSDRNWALPEGMYCALLQIRPTANASLEPGFAFAILGYVGSRADAPRNERRRRGGNAGITSPRIC
jgi:hypothetical protein